MSLAWLGWEQMGRLVVLCQTEPLEGANHRVLERFGVEGTLKIIQPQPPCHGQATSCVWHLGTGDSRCCKETELSCMGRGSVRQESAV